MLEQILPHCVAVAEAFERDSAEGPFSKRHSGSVKTDEGQGEGLAPAPEHVSALLERLSRTLVSPIPAEGATRLWPDSMIVSSAHCTGYRAITMAQRSEVAALGVDVQSNQALPDDGMVDLVAEGEEGQRLADLAACISGICWDRLLFSAKLSVYKAWFPWAAWSLNFDLADVTINPFNGTFEAHLRMPGPISGGMPLNATHGQWLADRGFLATSAVIQEVADKPGSLIGS